MGLDSDMGEKYYLRICTPIEYITAGARGAEKNGDIQSPPPRLHFSYFQV